MQLTVLSWRPNSLHANLLRVLRRLLRVSQHLRHHATSHRNFAALADIKRNEICNLMVHVHVFVHLWD